MRRRDWRHGVDIAQVKTALGEDTAHAIKAVCVVHNETADGHDAAARRNPRGD